MWWPDRRALRAARVAGAALGLLSLGGCFRPLYGPTASGAPLADVLASVDVDKVDTSQGQERLGQFLRNELTFGLDGTGAPHDKKYKLSLNTAETVQAVTVDVVTGRADTATLNATAKFTLSSLDGKTVLTAGTSRATATYTRDSQRFASVRAARDAEIRAAGLMAEDIRQRISAVLAVTP